MMYVLDTSALLALYQDESGAAAVARIFETRDKGEATISVSFITIFEITYLAMARGGDQGASSLLFQVRSLDMEEIWPDDDLLWQAGAIKAQGGLSVADAFVAASARVAGAVLVHRDSEFDRLDPDIQTLDLASGDHA